MKVKLLLLKVFFVNVLLFLSLPSYSQIFTSSIEWSNGRYEGDVTIRSLKRVPHGSGTYEDYQGNRYVGLWEDGKRNGSGVYYYVNGDKVVGTWVKGKLQGKAKYYHASGSISEIVYKDGKSISKTTISSNRSVTSKRTPTQRSVSTSNNSTTSTTRSKSQSTGTTSSTTRVVEQQRQPQPIQVWEDCWVCRGSGLCTICHGERYNYSGREYYQCGGCQGSGRCGTCYGRRGQYRIEYR